MINTVIFDLDGVIINSEPNNLRIIEGIYGELGIDVPYDFHMQSIGVESAEWWDKIIKTFKVEGKTAKGLAEYEREKIYDYTFSPKAEEIIFNGVEESVKSLKEKGFKLAVASSSPRKIINQVLKLANLDTTFDEIVSAGDGDVENGKPNPDIFLYAAEKLGSAPEECLVVEDSEIGLEAAKRAEMKTLAFLSGPKPISLENADNSFKDYGEFFENVNQII